MDIPYSAIDAAARAIAQFDPEWGTPASVPPSVFDRCAARAALEAAAPYITAQAWEEGVRVATDRALLVGAGAEVDELRNPYRD